MVERIIQLNNNLFTQSPAERLAGLFQTTNTMANKRTIGIKSLSERKFESIDLPPEWMVHLGEDIVKRFDLCVTGDAGHGKSTYVLKLCKVLSRFGKVFYNSAEQGFSQTLKTNIKIVDLTAQSGRIMFGDRLSFEELKAKLKTKTFHCSYLVIDSRDYMSLTFKQFQELKELRPKTMGIIVVCWSNGGSRPTSTDGGAIHYACDIKVHVEDFAAYASTRFGASEPYVIYDKGHKDAMLRKGKRYSKALKAAINEPTLFN